MSGYPAAPLGAMPLCDDPIVKFKLLALGAAFGAFAASGPLQHLGVLPETVVGNASKALIKSALNLGTKEAFAACRGRGWGKGHHR